MVGSAAAEHGGWWTLHEQYQPQQQVASVAVTLLVGVQKFVDGFIAVRGCVRIGFTSTLVGLHAVCLVATHIGDEITGLSTVLQVQQQLYTAQGTQGALLLCTNLYEYVLVFLAGLAMLAGTKGSQNGRSSSGGKVSRFLRPIAMLC